MSAFPRSRYKHSPTLKRKPKVGDKVRISFFDGTADEVFEANLVRTVVKVEKNKASDSESNPWFVTIKTPDYKSCACCMKPFRKQRDRQLSALYIHEYVDES